MIRGMCQFIKLAHPHTPNNIKNEYGFMYIYYTLRHYLRILLQLYESRKTLSTTKLVLNISELGN